MRQDLAFQLARAAADRVRRNRREHGVEYGFAALEAGRTKNTKPGCAEGAIGGIEPLVRAMSVWFVPARGRWSNYEFPSTRAVFHSDIKRHDHSILNSRTTRRATVLRMATGGVAPMDGGYAACLHTGSRARSQDS